MAQLFGNSWADVPPRATVWGHHGPTIFVSVIGAMALLAVQPIPGPPMGRPLLSIAIAMILIITWWEMRKHDRALCERCVADFPLNPAESAVTYRRRLAMVHLMADKTVSRWYLVGMLIACLLPVFTPAAFRVPALMVWLVALSSLGYLVLSGVSHRRLQPWCPQCGHQGGEEHVDTPEPMPVGGLGA